ncbi:hypothetical protein STHU_12350 [Allostella humosa]|nr:hypothetical protein STHU_12350 [Stella humosa]
MYSPAIRRVASGDRAVPLHFASRPRILGTGSGGLALNVGPIARRLGQGGKHNPFSGLASSLRAGRPSSDLLMAPTRAVDRGDDVMDWMLLIPAALVAGALAILVIVTRGK